jgi:transcription-repair coupling factor (superfamily II helicase)
MASATTQEDLSDLQEELIDRFGKMPDPAKALLETHRLRLRCKAWNVIKIDAGPERVAVQFGPNAPVNPAKVIKLIQTDSRFRLQGNDRLRADIASSKLPERLAVLQTVFQQVLDSNPTSP